MPDGYEGQLGLDTKVKEIQDGIYFDMSEDVYHAARALGSSGIKDLLISPLTFWTRSAFNPAKQAQETNPQSKGRLFHKRILEGPECFAEHYAVKPSKDDHPDAIDGIKALRERCAEMGLKKSGTIQDICDRIQEQDPHAALWPNIIAEWEAENEGKIAIDSAAMMEVEARAKIVEIHEDVKNAFRGGYPEVSIFWTDEHGIRCKMRADYLKVRFATDLKSFSNSLDMPLDDAVGRAMANYKYHAQGAHYLSGIEASKAMYREHGEVIIHGPRPPVEWLNEYAAPGSHRFAFVFLETGDVPNTVIRELAERERKGGDRNAYWVAAEMHIDRAKETFLTCMEHYGPDLPWVDPQPMRVFSDTDFPMYALA